MLTQILIIAFAFVVGAGLFPAIIYLFGKELPRSVRGVLARILWTIGALIHGPFVFFERDDGRVELVRARPDEDEIKVDGEWIDIDSDGGWSYLGKTRFGIAWEPTRDAFDETLADFGDVRADGSGEEGEAWRVLGQKRGGYRAVTAFRSHAEGWVVNIARVAARLRGAAGGSIADNAKRQALRDHGAGMAMGTKAVVYGILASLLLGALSGYVMFGL